MLELQVAFVVLGLALGGLFPLLVMQSRLQRKLDERLAAGQTYYATPSTDTWARKLGAAAKITRDAPAPAPAPPVYAIDNVSSGYSEAGSGWATETDASAFGGSVRYHAAGTGANSASFTFTSLEPGWYQVWATWTNGTNRAKNAPFTAWDGATNRGTFTVKQNVPPKDAFYAGRPWDLLGTVPVAGTSLEVRLTDSANGYVIADGVRLVPVRNAINVTALQKQLAGEDLTANVSVTVVTP